MQERITAIEQSDSSETAKEKWKEIIIPEMISSEESDSENEDVIIVKPLIWRSQKVMGTFRELDAANESTKTKQARRQRRKRVIGAVPSERSKPDNVPKWALN